MSLTDAKIRTLKPTDKPFKVSDSHGLYLLVKPGGTRHWYLKYRINGKESHIALGAYPAISLSDARQQREGIRKRLALNINPATQRAAERGSCTPETVFKTVALAWHRSNKKWSQNTADSLLASMNNHIFPVIGHLSVTELKPHHFIDLLKGIEEKGLLEVASRMRQHLSSIMRYVVRQELLIQYKMSHQERNNVRAAYIHKAEHLESRKAMMQWWSDYLDTCREAWGPPYIWGQEHRHKIACTIGDN
jgi:hypothetical protein